MSVIKFAWLILRINDANVLYPWYIDPMYVVRTYILGQQNQKDM